MRYLGKVQLISKFSLPNLPLFDCRRSRRQPERAATIIEIKLRLSDLLHVAEAVPRAGPGEHRGRRRSSAVRADRRVKQAPTCTQKQAKAGRLTECCCAKPNERVLDDSSASADRGENDWRAKRTRPAQVRETTFPIFFMMTTSSMTSLRSFK